VTQVRWGILGTGAISAKFIASLSSARGAEAVWVASRTQEAADRFARGAGIGRAIAGYAEAARAGNVDAIYIATPPAFHVEHALACIEAGTPVLVEKPFATSAADAQRIADAARARGVFAMEAMWTRFLPAAQALRDQLAGGAIGDVRFVTGSFGISQRPDPANGMFDPALGGGALAHLGAYPLSLGQWLFGTPSVVGVTGTVGASGVDEDAAFQLRYDSGTIASFLVSLRAWAPDEFRLLGSTGMLGFTGSIVRPHGLLISKQASNERDVASFDMKAKLRQNHFVHQLAQRLNRSGRSGERRIAHRYAGNGYQYEADEVRACLARGAVESEVMPLADSVAVAATADTIRAAIHAQNVKRSDAL
jgi:predicted dehydrogenase